jgi:hypothetical protein
MEMPPHFTNHRDAALMLLAFNRRINRSSAGFLGTIACDPTPLTYPQHNWLDRLLEQNELPPYAPEPDEPSQVIH